MIVTLRNLEMKDAEYMLEWMCDPVTCQYLRIDATKSSMKQVVQFIQNASNTERTIHKAVVDEEGVYLGTTSLKSIDKDRKEAEFAIALRRAYTHMGVGTQAMKQILNLAFYELQLARVYWCVSRQNVNAVNFYNKFIPAQMIKYVENEKDSLDLLWYEVNNEKWRAMYKK